MKPPSPKPMLKPQQLGLALTAVELGGLSATERQRALTLLAMLLLEASGLAVGETARERR